MWVISTNPQGKITAHPTRKTQNFFAKPGVFDPYNFGGPAVFSSCFLDSPAKVYLQVGKYGYGSASMEF